MTIKAIDFQDGIPPIPIDIFKDDYVVLIALTSMKDATQKCHYPELAGGPVTVELNFTFPLEHVFQLLVLGEPMSLVDVDKIGVVGMNI